MKSNPLPKTYLQLVVMMCVFHVVATITQAIVLAYLNG
jgi:hypothetical protein